MLDYSYNKQPIERVRGGLVDCIPTVPGVKRGERKQRRSKEKRTNAPPIEDNALRSIINKSRSIGACRD